MDVVRITPRGYCHGVVEAIRIAKREGAARAGSERVTMLGYLVHNEHVTRELEESGVALVAEPDRMKALEQVTDGNRDLHRPRHLAGGCRRGASPRSQPRRRHVQ